MAEEHNEAALQAAEADALKKTQQADAEANRVAMMTPINPAVDFAGRNIPDRMAGGMVMPVVADASPQTDRKAGSWWSRAFTRPEAPQPQVTAEVPPPQPVPTEVQQQTVPIPQGEPMPVENPNPIPTEEPVTSENMADNQKSDTELTVAEMRERYTEERANEDLENVQNAILAVLKTVRRADWRAKTDSKLRAALWKVGGLTTGIGALTVAAVLAPELAAAGGAVVLGGTAVAGALKLGSVVVPEGLSLAGKVVKGVGKASGAVLDVAAGILHYSGKGIEGTTELASMGMDAPKSLKEWWQDRKEKATRKRLTERVKKLEEQLKAIPANRNIDRARALDRLTIAKQELLHFSAEKDPSGPEVVLLMAESAEAMQKQAEVDMKITDQEVQEATSQVDKIIAATAEQSVAVDRDAQASERFDREVDELNKQIDEARTAGDKTKLRSLLGKKGAMMRWRGKRIEQYKSEIN